MWSLDTTRALRRRDCLSVPGLSLVLGRACGLGIAREPLCLFLPATHLRFLPCPPASAAGLRAAGKEREEREEREEQARALWPPPARRGKASGSHPRVWRSPEVLLQIQKTQGKDVPFYL